MCKQLIDTIGKFDIKLFVKNICNNNNSNNKIKNINITYNNSSSEELRKLFEEQRKLDEEQHKLDDIFRYGKNPIF